jgi:hypothetical protein
MAPVDACVMRAFYNALLRQSEAFLYAFLARWSCIGVALQRLMVASLRPSLDISYCKTFVVRYASEMLFRNACTLYTRTPFVVLSYNFVMRTCWRPSTPSDIRLRDCGCGQPNLYAGRTPRKIWIEQFWGGIVFHIQRNEFCPCLCSTTRYTALSRSV